MVANNSTAFTRLHFKHDGIHKLTWHPWRPYLVCVAKRGALLTEEEGPANNTSSSVSPSDVPFTVTVLAFDNQQALMLPVWEAIVAIPGRFGTSKLISINHHFSHPWLLFIFERGLYLWDYQNTIGIANRVLLRAVAKNGGFFPVTNCAWTLPLSSSGSVDWGVWEYQHDTYHEYELERYDHYGRGAALHPSGLLIGALWNAYACGYLIHSVQEVADGVLGYYEQPTAKRTEYENYAPAFSPDGALFAFICNSYVGGRNNTGRVCVYEMETARCITSFSTFSTRLNERDLQFVHAGKTLAYSVDDHINIHDRVRNWEPTVIKTTSTIQQLAGHPLFGLYALAHENEVSVIAINNDENQTLKESEGFAYSLQMHAQMIAERFMAANKHALLAVGSLI